MQNFRKGMVVACGVGVCVFSIGYFVAKAQTVENLQDQKSVIQNKLQELNKQINGFQNQIKVVQSQAASLKNEIFIYDTQIKSTELEIQAKQTQIADANLQINELQKQIVRRKNEINDNKNILNELLTQLHQMDDVSFVNMILSNNNFSDFLDQVQYTESVQDKVFQVVQNIKVIKSKLENQQADLKIQVARLEDYKEQLDTTQDALETQRSQKQNLLTRTRGVERNYQTLLASSEKEQADLQKEVDDLDNEIRRKLGDRTISVAKGALSWPMQGVMTQGYGNTGFRALGYSFHNGIDIAAPAGKPIYAPADGKVMDTDKSDASYGNWVTIKHRVETKDGIRDIIALYGHMRSFKVKDGDIVMAGDLIGYEGNTGNTTRLLYGPERGYHLHFTIFDAEGYRVTSGKYTKIYGPYKVPSGYTYNPLNFLK